jgi:hypothetical protein
MYGLFIASYSSSWYVVLLLLLLRNWLKTGDTEYSDSDGGGGGTFE